MGGKQWNELQKEVTVFCSNGTSGNFRDRSKGQNVKQRWGQVAVLQISKF